MLEESDITNAWRGRSCLILGNNEGGGQAVAPIVRGNTFHECGNPENGNLDHGVYAANVLDGEIVDNLFYNSAAYTIQLYPNAQRTRFAHNVVDGSGPSVRGGIVFGGDGRFASGDNVVERNVIAYAATAAITSYWEGPVGTGNLARDNCVWGSRGDDITAEWGFTAVANRVARPLFASRSARDYRLAPGSQCLRTVGYDTLARRFGALSVRKSFRAPLRIVARPPRVSAHRVRLEFRLRGVRAGTARVVIRRHGRGRVRTLHVRAKRRVLVRPLLRRGSYRAWAQVQTLPSSHRPLEARPQLGGMPSRADQARPTASSATRSSRAPRRSRAPRFTAVLMIFLVRYLGPEDYGVFALALGVGGLMRSRPTSASR